MSDKLQFAALIDKPKLVGHQELLGLLILYAPVSPATAFKEPLMTRIFRRSAVAILATLILLGSLPIHTSAQRPQSRPGGNKQAFSDAAPDDSNQSEMRPIIEYYVADRGSLQRSYPVSSSPARRERFRKFYTDARERIQKLNFDSMSQEGKVDYILFRSHLEHELRQLDLEAKQMAEIDPLIPFSKTMIDFEESRRRMEPIDSAKAATTLNSLRKQVEDTRRSVEAGLRGSDSSDTIKVKKTVAFRAVNAITSLRANLRNWYTFYNSYDPVFTWWNDEPYKTFDEALTGYASFLSERALGSS